MVEPTTLASANTNPETAITMSMERFHCDTFEMRIQFDSIEMNTAAFLETVKQRGVAIDANKEGEINFSITFGSRDGASGFHSHLRAQLRKDGSGKAELNYHPSSLEDKGDEPYVEDCTQWLAQFFREKVTAHLHVNYTFDTSFTPAVILNFPLVTSEKSLAGALVAGLALVFPNDKTTIIQSGKNETYVFIRETVQMDLSKFDLINELERLSVMVNSLVKKKADQ